MNLEDPGLLLLLTWILLSIPLYSISYLISCLCFMSYMLRLLPCFLPLPSVLCVTHLLFLPYVLCITSLVLSLAFTFCLMRYISRLVSCFVSCVLHLLPCFLLVKIPFLFKCSRSIYFFSLLPCILYVIFLASFFTFVLCLLYCISRFISYLVPCVLRLLSCFLFIKILFLIECNISARFFSPLSCILYIMFLTSFFAFFISDLMSCALRLLSVLFLIGFLFSLGYNRSAYFFFLYCKSW